MSRTRPRLTDTPPFTVVGLLWPWLTPSAIRNARGVAEPVGDDPSFTLVSANALGPNRRAAEFAAALTEIDTDVLVVVEASKLILDALEAAEVSRFHQHGLIEKRRRWGGCGIWSRHPLELIEAGDAGHAYVAARVALPSSSVTIVAVHTLAPARLGTGPGWRASFDKLASVIARLDGPVVAAGDYNATLGHRPLRELMERTALRDAHTAAGRGLARSWPEARYLPALGLIDRVLVSRAIGVSSIYERVMPGSDHRALIATLSVKQ